MQRKPSLEELFGVFHHESPPPGALPAESLRLIRAFMLIEDREKRYQVISLAEDLTRQQAARKTP
jgi:hypothetical protein